MENREVIFENAIELLQNKAFKRLRDLMTELNPADVAELFSEFHEVKSPFFPEKIEIAQNTCCHERRRGIERRDASCYGKVRA